MKVDETTADEVLAARVQAGDIEQFGLLVERYEEKLLRYGRKFVSRKEDVEDLVQTAFMNAYENIRSFDATARFSPWMYRIAHNVFVNSLREKSRRPLVFVDFDTFFAHPAYDDPDEELREQQELKAALDANLEKLAPKYREVLVLHYLEHMSYKEIADILQVPTGTVGVRILRAKELLRKTYPDNPLYGI